MSSNAGLTEVITIKKLFKWTINNFNKLDASNMERKHGEYVVESPKMTAIDPYVDRKYTATFTLKFMGARGYFYFQSSITPYVSGDIRSYYFNINDDSKDISFTDYNQIKWNGDIKKLTFFVDINGTRNIIVSPFKKVNHKKLGSSLKEMWKNDLSVKYTIKCGKKVLDTYKPFLAVKSLFFKDMFESTTQSFVEITDFRFEVLQKMVEFCETDDIKEVNGYECELFKAAHKYQMNDLMDFSVEKMSENANASNILAYRELAKNYKLKDFEEWCMKFAFPPNVNV